MQYLTIITINVDSKSINNNALKTTQGKENIIKFQITKFRTLDCIYLKYKACVWGYVHECVASIYII